MKLITGVCLFFLSEVNHKGTSCFIFFSASEVWNFPFWLKVETVVPPWNTVKFLRKYNFKGYLDLNEINHWTQIDLVLFWCCCWIENNSVIQLCFLDPKWHLFWKIHKSNKYMFGWYWFYLKSCKGFDYTQVV